VSSEKHYCLLTGCCLSADENNVDSSSLVIHATIGLGRPPSMKKLTLTISRLFKVLLKEFMHQLLQRVAVPSMLC